MTRKILTFVLILVSTIYINGETNIRYPDCFFIEDVDTGFRILLGSTPGYVQRFYGGADEKILLFEASVPKYKIWQEDFGNGLVLNYDTYENVITYIKVRNDGFITSKGIHVGSVFDDVLKKYGYPTDQTRNKNGELTYLYESVQKEITMEGEYTLISFSVRDNIVIEILFEIVSSV